MSFPQTRLSLIQRIAEGNQEQDWREFFADYWGPVCRFSLRQGSLTFEEAEDVASQTFEALWKNELLVRWVSARSAKLRTLLCSVVRNILANRARVQKGRANSIREHGGRLDDRANIPIVTSFDAPAEQVDAFYSVWVDEIVQQAAELLLLEYHRAGKGDYFRVLYGRLCEGLTTRETAQALDIKQTQVENYYKNARSRLSQNLEKLVGDHVRRYSSEEEAASEFESEWGLLGEYLRDHGGLEEAVRRAYQGALPPDQKRRMGSAMQTTWTRLSEIRRSDTATNRAHSDNAEAGD